MFRDVAQHGVKLADSPFGLQCVYVPLLIVVAFMGVFELKSEQKTEFPSCPEWVVRVRCVDLANWGHPVCLNQPAGLLAKNFLVASTEVV